jgi:hypothetical protein
VGSKAAALPTPRARGRRSVLSLARLGAPFDRLRAQTQRVLMALHVARLTRLALDDDSTTVLALDHRLNLAATRLTFGSSTLGAPDAHRRRAVRQLLVVHAGILHERWGRVASRTPRASSGAATTRPALTLRPVLAAG